MFDSDIVIDAIEGICGETSGTARAGLELLKSCERFCVSSVTTFELLHTTNPRQGEVFRTLPLEEHGLTWRVSKLASDIANHARRHGLVCEQCWAMLPNRTCGKCNSQVARQQRINDMLIAATAEVNRVPFLYARDGGMIELGKLPFFQNTRIIAPPDAPPQLALIPDNTVRLEPKKKRKKR